MGIKDLLSTLESNNSLLELDFSYSKLSEFSLQIISFSLRNLKSLAKLSFCSCLIGDSGAQIVFNGLKESLSIREIDLVKNNLTSVGSIYISETLKVNLIIQKLNLYSNKISAEGAKYLSQANGNLSELNLADNEIKAEGVKALADNLAFSKNLVYLNLNRNNGYQSSFSLHVAEILAISISLEKIDLGNNFIGYDGIKSIFLALRNNSQSKVFEISLESNEIDNRATSLISEYLQTDMSLTSLNLTNNYLGPEGAQSLSTSLKVNKTLKMLYLANNHLGHEGCIYIAQGLRFNRSLVTIDLGKNDIERKSLTDVETAISKNDNTSLQNIILSEKNIEPKVFMSISNLLKTKRKLNK